MKLYLITYNNEDGENLDQLVWAAAPSAAIQLWHDAWEFDSAVKPDRIFEVSTAVPSAPGIVQWHTPALQEV